MLGFGFILVILQAFQGSWLYHGCISQLFTFASHCNTLWFQRVGAERATGAVNERSSGTGAPRELCRQWRRDVAMMVEVSLETAVGHPSCSHRHDQVCWDAIGETLGIASG